VRARQHPPRPGEGPYLTDSGLETELVFLDGIDLPEFAAYPLLATDDGLERLRRYYTGFARLARAHGYGLVLETPTWRASSRWGQALGHAPGELADLNRRAVALLEEVAAADGPERTVISGQLGPHGDGYDPAERLTEAEARAYHAPQLEAFAQAGADMAGALTITTPAEATGIVRAAQDAGLPVAIGFTVETDGRLPDGTALGRAIDAVDAATDAAAAYFVVNCAHPTHLEPAIDGGDGGWRDRVLGVRPNASTRSHAELDAMTELDAGDPADLARRTIALREHLPRLTVLGGCCGTDLRHVEAIADAWAARAGGDRFASAQAP
jgi:homocysteine S-methyltransferase